MSVPADTLSPSPTHFFSIPFCCLQIPVCRSVSFPSSLSPFAACKYLYVDQCLFLPLYPLLLPANTCMSISLFLPLYPLLLPANTCMSISVFSFLSILFCCLQIPVCRSVSFPSSLSAFAACKYLYVDQCLFLPLYPLLLPANTCMSISVFSFLSIPFCCLQIPVCRSVSFPSSLSAFAACKYLYVDQCLFLPLYPLLLPADMSNSVLNFCGNNIIYSP